MLASDQNSHPKQWVVRLCGETNEECLSRSNVECSHNYRADRNRGCAAAGGASAPPEGSVAPKVVEVSPPEAKAEVGQQVKFTAVGKDASGQVVPGTPSLWFAAPFDLAGVENGTVTLYQPGEVRVGAV